MAAGFTSFFTGVTEPLEFSFMFLAPVLYFVHAVLTGLSMFIAATFQWTAGFGFSAGFIDYVLTLRLPLANLPLMLVLQGLVFAIIYYYVFKFLILKFYINIIRLVVFKISGRNYAGLGGTANVSSIEHCATRLRVEVAHMEKVDQKRIKKIQGSMA